MNSNQSNTESEDWDLIIRPKRNWLELHLGDLWRYRDLILLFVRRDFVAQYKQTILGPAWFVINPLIATLMYTVVFGNIAKLSTDGLPQVIFYMSGVILWEYFAQCLTQTSTTFVTNANIFGKVYFPRLAVPISLVISHLFKFGLQFAFFLCFWAYFFATSAPIQMNWAALLFPILVMNMAALSLGLGIIITSMTTKYRDLQNLLTFGIRMAMYATPVIYPLSSVESSRFHWLLWINPMSPIIETFRYGFLGTGSFHLGHLLYSIIFSLIALFIGIVFFNRIEKNFMDTV